MSLEAFVRSAGTVMGMARESFGAGGGVMTVPPSIGAAPAAPIASGLAADGSQHDSSHIHTGVSMLGEHDHLGSDQLSDAIAGSAAGRARMDAVIDAAMVDVAALGMSTDTPQGQAALVKAIKHHLEDTKSTLDTADADASTKAAAANTTAAGYNGVNSAPAGMPAGAMMAAPGGMPMGFPGGGMRAGGGLPIPPLASLASMIRSGAGQSGSAVDAEPTGAVLGSGSDPGASSAAAIPVDQVNFSHTGKPGGREAYRTYIAQALDVMGIKDPVARANWTRGLEVGLPRESGFDDNSVNLRDSNAHGSKMPDGAPAGSSRGGMQTVPGTFAANHQPGTSTSIYDPVANLCAGMNYLMRQYHVSRDGSNLSSVGQFNPNHPPGGY